MILPWNVGIVADVFDMIITVKVRRQPCKPAQVFFIARKGELHDGLAMLRPKMFEYFIWRSGGIGLDPKEGRFSNTSHGRKFTFVALLLAAFRPETTTPKLSPLKVVINSIILYSIKGSIINERLTSVSEKLALHLHHVLLWLYDRFPSDLVNS